MVVEVLRRSKSTIFMLHALANATLQQPFLDQKS